MEMWRSGRHEMVSEALIGTDREGWVASWKVGRRNTWAAALLLQD
jgi:hypothetical protein